MYEEAQAIYLPAFLEDRSGLARMLSCHIRGTLYFFNARVPSLGFMVIVYW